MSEKTLVMAEELTSLRLYADLLRARLSGTVLQQQERLRHMTRRVSVMMCVIICHRCLQLANKLKPTCVQANRPNYHVWNSHRQHAAGLYSRQRCTIGSFLATAGLLVDFII